MRDWRRRRASARARGGPASTTSAPAPGGVQIVDGHAVPLERIAALAQSRPVEAALMSEYIEALASSPMTRSQMLCVLDPPHPDGHGDLIGLCLLAGNLVPVGVPEHALPALARHLQRSGRRYSSVVGSAEQVLGLWSLLAGSHGPARDVRADQPSLVLDHEPRIEAQPQVRPAREEDLDVVIPACVAMFTEEVGYSPLTGGGGYERRIRSLVRDRRALVWIQDERARREVVFKAEVGTVGLGVAQIQGVWVNPRYRGRGLAAPGMAAVASYTRANLAPTVSLYVNAYNAAALATYRRVGFRQVGTFATVLL